MLTQERLVEIHVLETQEEWAKYYYESGAIESEGSFKNYKQEGLVKSYYESGAIKSELNYKNGELVGEWTRK
jgi:antitoxin component YwqK of YwqJK toxin-antitoxin module